MHATISTRAYQFRPTNGTRADGVHLRLECSKWRRYQVDGVRRRHQDEKDNKKVQIYSKIKIDDFWSILIKVESSWLNDAQNLNTVNAEAMIWSSPMAEDKMSSMSSRKHRIRHPMESCCGSKSKKNNGGWWRWSINEIDRKVDRAVVVGFRRSRYRTLYFLMFWMQRWVLIEEIPMSNAGYVQIG